MSLTRQYERIDWENEPSSKTPLNDVNLNKMDFGIYTLEGNLISLDVTKVDQSEVLECLSGGYFDGVYHKPVEYDYETGIFRFYMKDGTVLSFDLNVEKIPVSFALSEDGILIMETADGTVYSADIAGMIKTVMIADSETMAWTFRPDENGNLTWTGSIKAGSITDEMLESHFLSDCILAKVEAEAAAGRSGAGALTAEGFALGTQNGEPVSEDSPYYHNNAKYYSEKADDSKTVSGVLYAGATAITFEDSFISQRSILRLYAENKLLTPKSVSASEGAVTYTFKAQETDTNLLLEIVEV